MLIHNTLLFRLFFLTLIAVPLQIEAAFVENTHEDFTQAEEFFEKTLTQGIEQKDQSKVLEALKLAQESYERAVASRQPKQADFAFHTARAFRALKDWRNAYLWFRKAAVLFEEQEDQESVAWSLNGAGTMYFRLGDFIAALQLYNAALKTTEPKLPKAGPTIHGNIGTTYSRLGSYANAHDHLDIAMSFEQKSEDFDLLTRIYIEKTRLFRLEKKCREMKPLMREAQKLIDKHGLSVHQSALDLENIACMLWEKQFPQAKSLVTKHLITNDDQMSSSYLHVLATRALIDFHLGRYQQSLADAGSCLRGFKALEDHAGEEFALQLQALNHAALGDYDHAETYFKMLLTQVENRSETYSNEMFLDYQFPRHDFYETYIQFLMNHHQEKPAAGFDAKALSIVEMVRSRTKLRDLFLSMNTGNLESERGLLNQDTATPPSDTFNTFMRAKLEETTPARELQMGFRRELAAWDLERAHPKNQTINSVNPNWPLLQQQLAENEAALYFELGEPRSYVWVVDRHSRKVFALADKDTIRKAVFSYLDVASKRQGAANQRAVFRQAEHLGKLLFKPFADRIAYKRLIIIGDDALHRIPLAGLIDPSQAKPSFLSERFQFIRVPSLLYLTVLRQRQAGRPEAKKQAIVLTDPVYEAEDERIQKNSKKPETKVKDLDPSPLHQRNLLNRLIYSLDEAKAIQNLIGEEQTLIVQDFAVTPAVIHDPAFQESRLIHISAHGLPYPYHSQFSALALSMYSEDGTPTQGFVSAYQIENTTLRAQLVVLSACESGLGKADRGEGLLGLPHAFLNAGASSVLTTLWPILDNETLVKFTQDFYQSYCNNQKDPAESLQIAQQKMRERGLTSPYYWAGFVLMGEPNTEPF